MGKVDYASDGGVEVTKDELRIKDGASYFAYVLNNSGRVGVCLCVCMYL